MAKGSAYERTIARELSLWWSEGVSDDLFWRSSQSGGRATQRAKSGKTTKNACGDLAAMSPEAQKLFDLMTVEIKRGYNDYTISDLVDKPQTDKKIRGFSEFIQQAARDASLAGVEFWLLIHKRDRRDALAISNFIFSGEPGFDFYSSQYDRISICPLSQFLSRKNREWLQREWGIRFGK